MAIHNYLYTFSYKFKKNNAHEKNDSVAALCLYVNLMRQ